MLARRKAAPYTEQLAVHVAQQILDLEVADRDAEVLRRDVLELMRLVDDERRAIRDDFTELALSHRRIRAQQVVVDDDDVGVGGALAHLRDEAVVPARALLPETRVGVGRDVLPERMV